MSTTVSDVLTLFRTSASAKSPRERGPGCQTRPQQKNARGLRILVDGGIRPARICQPEFHPSAKCRDTKTKMLAVIARDATPSSADCVETVDEAEMVTIVVRKMLRQKVADVCSINKRKFQCLDVAEIELFESRRLMNRIGANRRNETQKKNHAHERSEHC